MILLLATVRHTGSKTTRDSILKGFNTGSIKGGHTYKDMVIFDHIMPSKMHWWRNLLGTWPLIIPLRHPHDCALSWKKRGEPIKDMIEAWHLLVDEFDPFEPLYLPMGSDEHLQKINAATGLDLHTDWPVINSHPGAGVLKRTEQESVSRLCNDIGDFLERFFPLGEPAAGVRAH